MQVLTYSASLLFGPRLMTHGFISARTVLYSQIKLRHSFLSLMIAPLLIQVVRNHLGDELAADAVDLTRGPLWHGGTRTAESHTRTPEPRTRTTELRDAGSRASSHRKKLVMPATADDDSGRHGRRNPPRKRGRSRPR